MTGTASADLTLNGAVGLPLNPTAEKSGLVTVQAQAEYSDLGSIGGNDFKFYGAHGAAVLNRLEISGGVEKMNAEGPFDNADQAGLALGAKYALRAAPLTPLRVAAGAGYSRALFRNTHAYLVATQAFPSTGTPLVTAHLGVRYDRFKLNGGDSNRASLYGGAEVPLGLLLGAPDLTLIGEMQSKNAGFSQSKFPYSVSLRYRPVGRHPARPFSAKFGWQRQGVTGDSGFFAQVSFGF